MVISGNRTPTAVQRFTEMGQNSDPYFDLFIERYERSFEAEIDAFVEAFEQGTPPQVGFEDGRIALVLAEAAYKSIAENRMILVSEIG